MPHIISFSDIKKKDHSLVGGKNAYLGDMYQNLTSLGIKVPPGFAVTTKAYEQFLEENNLKTKIADLLSTLNPDDLDALKNTSTQIRRWIVNASLPAAIVNEITLHFMRLTEDKCQVAVRSSATAEDMPEASFAGQQETILNVTTKGDLLNAIKQVYASLFTERAISYRAHHAIDHHSVLISVGIQRMVRSDLGVSGITFTLDTETGFDQVVFITASYGLGEVLVQGKINPDEFYVHKQLLRRDFPAIVGRQLGNKSIKMTYGDTSNIKTEAVSEREKLQFCLKDEDILLLARQALVIEEYYQRPMDIEWAKDGLDGEIYTVQARPETVKSRESNQVVEEYKLIDKGRMLVEGRSVGRKIGQGTVKVVLSPHDKHLIQAGDILVTDSTDPDWEPIMKLAAGIVTNHGGRTCHAAIIARELGIPAVIGCGDATEKLKTGEPATISCAEGETGYVYDGLLKFQVSKSPVEKMPDLPVKICMNVANPERAFSFQSIPNEGVGLARIEFIISSMIGIHPNAILAADNLPEELKDSVIARSFAYGSPRAFYVGKLSEGIAMIGAAFYPKPVIVRFSDFKTNEYADLLGGYLYESKEENPMLGYRGTYRYTTGRFKDAFLLECEAICRVRNHLGLTNVHIMLPFVRTLKEAEKAIALLASAGLHRGDQGLKFYMMCEVPSNVILAEKFLQHFDGFSIGSNDLTQLTLGVDRESEQVADVFDERDEAVKRSLHHVISICRAANKYVGICGQGPSDHVDFAKWLVSEGIESISLNPDTIIKTSLAISHQLQNNAKKDISTGEHQSEAR